MNGMIEFVVFIMKHERSGRCHGSILYW